MARFTNVLDFLQEENQALGELRSWDLHDTEE